MHPEVAVLLDHLQVSVKQPVQLEVVIVLSKGVDEGLGHLDDDDDQDDQDDDDDDDDDSDDNDDGNNDDDEDDADEDESLDHLEPTHIEGELKGDEEGEEQVEPGAGIGGWGHPLQYGLRWMEARPQI